MSKRAKDLCSGVRVLQDETLELAEQVVLMADKLAEFRKTIKNEPLCVEYDNGGGQTGIRENPNFRAYEKLLSAYTKALNQLATMLEDAAPSANASDIIGKLQVIASNKVG